MPHFPERLPFPWQGYDAHNLTAAVHVIRYTSILGRWNTPDGCFGNSLFTACYPLATEGGRERLCFAASVQILPRLTSKRVDIVLISTKVSKYRSLHAQIPRQAASGVTVPTRPVRASQSSTSPAMVMLLAPQTQALHRPDQSS
jgi:hypothetical protein